MVPYKRGSHYRPGPCAILITGVMLRTFLFSCWLFDDPAWLRGILQNALLVRN